MAGVVPEFIFLDKASIYALLDKASNLVDLVSLVRRGMDVVLPQTLQTLV